MNTPLLFSKVNIYSATNKLRIPILWILTLICGTAYSQDIAITTAAGGLVASPIPTGIANVSIFGVTLTKAGGGTRSVAGLTFAMTSDPNGKFTNPRLYESADATFSGVGAETLIAGGVSGTLNATDISFSGGTITNFGGASGGATAFMFLVVDVASGASGNIQPSLATTGVATAATVTGSTITGTNYAFTAPVTTIANLSTGLAASPLVGGLVGRGVYGFSLTSTGGQTVTAINVQVTSTAVGKWGTYSLITSTDNSFATTGDNSAAIGGLSFDPSSGTQIAITGLSESITTSAKNYFLVVDINGAVTGATTAVQPSVAGASNITFGTGTGAGTATGTNYSFIAPVTTIANLSTGLAASPLLAGSTGLGVYGFSLTSTGGQTVTAINVQVTSTAVGKWGTYSLITSTDNSLATTGDNSAAIGGLSFDPSSGTQVAITGLTESITSSTKNYFLIVDINGAVTGATTAVQPSVAGATNITFGTGTGAGTATGTNYSFIAPVTTIANLSTGLATSPLVAGATGQGVYGFSLTSTGTQSVTAINIQVTSTAVSKWGNYSLITSTDNSFATTGDNSAAIGGLSFDPSSGTQIVITGLSQSITTSTKNYFLVVDINAGVNASTTAIQPSVAGASNITFGAGTGSGTATGTNYSFTPLLTLTNLTTGLAPSPLIAGAVGQGVFGFALSSSGSQTVSVINVQVTSTAVSKLVNYALITSTDNSFATTGDNSAAIGGLTFDASSGTQIAITGLSQVITTGTNYFLLADINAGVTGATTAIQPSLATANITVSTGGKTGSATGTNYSFGLATATFAQLATGIATSPLSAGVSGQAVIGFSASSNGSQAFTTINIQVSSTPVSKWGSYSLVRSTDASFATTGDNTTVAGTINFTPSATQIAITGINTETLNSTAKNYFLVITADPSATTATAAIQPSFTQANISVSPGTPASVTVTGTNYTFNTSQLSDITLVSGPTNPINYRTHQAATINDTDTNLSLRLAQFQIRDGGGASDGDDKVTSITQITLDVTGFSNIRQIALTNATTDVEIAGTEQTVGASNLITFIPSSPIRTATDGGTFEFKVRVTWKAAVLDNDPVFVAINNVVGESGFSGFATGNAGGATTSGVTNKTVIVTATKFIYQPVPPGTTSINANFGPITIKAVDGNPQNNRDLDYNGKLDLTISGGAGSLTGGGVITLASGQVTVPNLQINQSGAYTLDAIDDDYTDAPENQPDLGDPSAAITITSSASTITQPSALNLCFGGTFQTLGNIVITETDPSGFSNSGSFAIGLPSGFVFDTGINPTLSMSNSTTTFSNVGFTGGNIVQFDYSIASPTGNNALTIAGLKIRYPGNTAPGGGNLITRSGGTAIIAGVTAGTQLGTVNAALGATPVGFGFTVIKVNPGDVDVSPSETRFSQSSNAVRLVPSHGTTAGVDYTFTGPGVTLISGQYRFNAQSLSPSPPLYDIVYTFTDAPPQACQFTATKSFEVYTTNVTGLNVAYCNNEAQTPSMNVDSYIATTYPPPPLAPPLWQLDKFVYWNTPGGRNSDGSLNGLAGPGPVNLANTTDLVVANKIFDPKLTAYQPVYSSTGSVYGVIGIWIGFIIHEVALPSNTRLIWQLIPVRPAPTVSFSIAPTFCADDPSVTLVGLPANSNTIADDFFDDGPLTTVSVTPTNPRIWSFSPSALGGSGPVSITYTYRDPSTGCSATTLPTIVTVNSRPGTVASSDITSLGGVSPQICQNGSLGTFTATPLTPPNEYRWYEDAALTIQRGTGNSFAPTNPPANPATSGTTNFYVTQFVSGCESNKQPVSPTPALTLSVIVNPIPNVPVPNFPNTTREYCVGTSITDSHLAVPGTGVKWYNNLGAQILPNPGSNPIAADLSLSTSIDKIYSFTVTQTAAGCESLPTPVTVTVKALPSLTFTADSDETKICTTGSNVTFSAFDGGNPASGDATASWSSPGLSSSLNSFPLIGKVILSPASITPGTYPLTFNFTNSAGCSKFSSINFTILPTITPSLSIPDVCNGSPVSISNNSVVNPLGGATIDFAEWTLGDGNSIPIGPSASLISLNSGKTSGTNLNPNHIYPNVGTFQISGALTTSDGCRYLIPNTPVTVSALPKIDFSWKDVCRDGTSITQFTANEKTTPTPIAIATYTWDFKVNNSLTYTAAGVGATPTVSYDKDGTDNVSLTVTTAAGCTDTKTKPVYIVPSYPAITPTNSYNQTFDGGADGWIAGGQNSSWALGTPNKTVIKGASSGANAWVTKLTGNNNTDESSWVLSRCFDFTQSAKPVFSVDIWSNTPRGVDGAVLQYNENGNIENDANWIVVGTVGSGVNWYDDQGISNSPGNQLSGDLGWTGDASSSGGKYSTYQKAIFKLDNLIGKPKVVFRIAFASSQASKDGFAFDNIFIGERSRVVLIENFTNSSTASANVHNDLYRTFGNSAEIVKVQYHTPFPGNDPLNALNTQMNNARAAFYGITSAPTARVDGDFVNGNLINWLPKYYDDRVLTPSLIKLDVTAVKTGSTVKISTTITNNSGQSVPLAGVHIFTTVVEKSIVSASLLGNSGNSEFVYVAKQMLPSSTGLIIPNNLAAGQSYTAPDVIWENNNGDAIAISVQSVEGSNKNVFQSTIINNPPQPDVVTGLGDLLVVDRISIYPNPADDELTIQLPTAAPKRLQLQMVDQVGRVVNEHFISEGERSKTISTRDLAGGIYLLQLGSGNTSTRKKIMIVHGK